MAQGIGTTSQIVGLTQTFGGLGFNVLDYAGSSSYVQGGDSISPSTFGLNSTIWTLIGSMDQSCKFRVEPRALNNGVTQWQLVFVSLTTGTVGGQSQTAGAEAATGTNLSTFKVRLAAIGQ
jgi:hypothetical protein